MMLLAIVVFAGALALIATDRVDRTKVALIGASVVVLIGAIDQERAIEAIEFEAMGLLAGMIAVRLTETTGVYNYIAMRHKLWIEHSVRDRIMQLDAKGALAATDGNRTAELLTIAWGSAIGGGVIDNIPLTAAMVPVVDQIAGESGDDAYWWALALGACFGGNLTLVGAAANVAGAGVAARAGRPIGFVQFLRYGVPATLLSMVLVTGYILLRYA